MDFYEAQRAELDQTGDPSTSGLSLNKIFLDFTGKILILANLQR